MFRVMIADDERIAIDSLKYIIDKNFNNVEIIATARSGREAIEKVEYSVPDIVFMDIKMPGINGIETIREIKKLHRHVVFIILSAFDQFEFAKEAVNLGVIEYLLKPANRKKVVEALNKAIDIVKAEKENRKNMLELKEKIERIQPVLENGFIYSLVMFDNNKKELLNYRELLSIEENNGYVMTIEFSYEEDKEGLVDRIGNNLKSRKVYSLFRDTVSNIGKCIVGPLMLNRVVVFVPVAYMTEDSAFVQRAAIAFAETLSKHLSGKLECGLKIGIGNQKSFETMSASYEEALKALRSLNGTGIKHFMDITLVNTQGYPEHKEKLLMQSVALGDKGESIEAFNCIFDWLSGVYNGQHLRIKNKLLELLFLVQRMAGKYDSETDGNETDFLEEMLSIEDMTELRLWGKRIVEDVAGKINVYRSYKTGELITRAKEYIEANYAKSITLEDISNEINVSPQYLSKLFKEETGENFIDYLTGIRIRIAKDLLENKNSSIKEICYNTGYSDPNYFSRIFKKIVGVTPTEYKGTFTA
ncbi:response regulator [Acetivibrio cellulolyticus]|uniref:response regulator n=1 Tax=Acetivibrio cellulolyticus TaxID=35830 RepID=UPI0001E2DE85|nr:response regulator [Acetivibrio cellulolyticus]